MRIFRISIVVCLFASTVVMGDSWRPVEVLGTSSNNGDYVARVLPARTYWWQRKPLAIIYKNIDEEYVQQESFNISASPAPAEIAISNNGYLYTFDRWGQLGGGDVVVAYSPLGKMIKKYKLEDLYTDDQIEKIFHTKSSTHWRCTGYKPWFNIDLIVQDSIGGYFVFKEKQATFTYHNESKCGD